MSACLRYSIWLSVWLLLYLPILILFSYGNFYSANDPLAEISPFQWQEVISNTKKIIRVIENTIWRNTGYMYTQENELLVCMSVYWQYMFLHFYRYNATVWATSLSLSHHIEINHKPTKYTASAYSGWESLLMGGSLFGIATRVGKVIPPVQGWTLCQ